jgi:hypothetical protein
VVVLCRYRSVWWTCDHITAICTCLCILQIYTKLAQWTENTDFLIIRGSNGEWLLVLYQIHHVATHWHLKCIVYWFQNVFTNHGEFSIHLAHQFSKHVSREYLEDLWCLCAALGYLKCNTGSCSLFDLLTLRKSMFWICCADFVWICNTHKDMQHGFWILCIIQQGKLHKFEGTSTCTCQTLYPFWEYWYLYELSARYLGVHFEPVPAGNHKSMIEMGICTWRYEKCFQLDLTNTRPTVYV